MSNSDFNLGPADKSGHIQGQAPSVIFISYSHDDKGAEWYQKVKPFLEQLTGELSFWDDNEIKPGEAWHKCIDEKLASARIAVLLVTPTFLTSKFIKDEELPKLLERHQQDSLIVHALLAVKSSWGEDHPIACFIKKYQLVHDPEQTLEEMDESETSNTLNRLVERIREQIQTQTGFLHRYEPSRRNDFMDKVARLVEPDGLKITHEIASGDTSVIYHAKGELHDFAIKAMISIPVSDAGQKEILQEVDKCRNFRDPTFIKIYKLTFDENYCVAMTDQVSGYNLRYHLRWLSQGMSATSIVLQLAEAIAESHQRDLKFLKIDPANILIEDGRPRIYPIDFSSWFASAAHKRGSLAISIETLPYLAPEYFHIRAEPDQPKAKKQIYEEELRVKKLADQFSLGMIALTLLEKSAPVKAQSLADVQKLLKFHKNPRAYELDDRKRLDDQPWRREYPALARVIWRMLECEPRKRWKDMAMVVSQLKAVLGHSTDIQSHVGKAKVCYLTRIRGNDRFYTDFYSRMFDASTDIKAKFKDINLAKQGLLLDAAIERLLNYRESQEEPTTLTSIAESHRKHGLSDQDYEIFGKSFLASLEEIAKVKLATRDAWEAVLWPGIEYLKRNSVTANVTADQSTPP